MEEYFYLFFPFAVLLCFVIVKRRTASVALAAVVLIVLCTVGRLSNMYGSQYVSVPIMHEHPFMRMDCAAYGVLAAYLVNNNVQIVQWMLAGRCNWTFLLSASLTAVWGILYVVILHTSVNKLISWGFSWWSPFYFAIQHSFLNAVFAIMIISVYFMHIKMPFYAEVCVRNLSYTSYSVYLFHTIVVEGANIYLYNQQVLAKCALVVVVTLVVAAISYYGVEKPLLQLRDWVVPGRTPLGPNK